VRLKPRADLPLWGREVMVEVPQARNHFILGEKVRIALVRGFFNSAPSNLNPHLGAPSSEPQPLELQVPEQIRREVNLEPSGMTYLPDLDKYLLVSDETGHDNPARLYLINSDGSVDENPVDIQGLDRMTDMESVTQDDLGNVYLLSSQARNKKGALSAERQLLVRLKRDRRQLRLDGQVQLRQLLEEAAALHPKAPWAKYLRAGRGLDGSDGDIDIEGAFWNNGNLYLGFKEPLTQNGQAMILKIRSIDLVFSKGTLSADQLEVWRTLDLKSQELGEERTLGIADMTLANGQLYVLGTCLRNRGASDNRKCGALFKLGFQSGEEPLKVIRTFPGLQPEALAYRSDTGDLLIGFDAGKSGTPAMIKLPDDNKPSLVRGR
jgi:hypothetical protein